MPPVKQSHKDWRRLEYREDLFLRYFKWRTWNHDLDHSHYCQVLCQDMTAEQKVWFSFLFGMTYRTPQAYAYWWHFPEFSEIDKKSLVRWNSENWERTTYGTDARYNKGHFHSQTLSLMEWTEGKGLYEKIEELTSGEDPNENFERLFAEVCKVYKFGRMTGWLTCQCLYDVLDLNIDFQNVFVRSPVSDSGMQSVWNGYQTLVGRSDRFLGKKYSEGSYSPSQRDIDEATEEVMNWRRRAEKYTGRSVDVFKWESIWCQFKRLFRPGESHEYPGHSSGDATSRYPYYKEHWPEVDWSRFREALLSQPGLVRGRTYVNEYNKIFGRTGLLLNMHEMYPDLPDAHSVLGMDRDEDLVESLFSDHGVNL